MIKHFLLTILVAFPLFTFSMTRECKRSEAAYQELFLKFRKEEAYRKLKKSIRSATLKRTNYLNLIEEMKKNTHPESAESKTLTELHNQLKELEKEIEILNKNALFTKPPQIS